MADLLATLIPVLGRALLHFMWQGVVIGLVAALALLLLRNARPQARYAVACIAMLACVVVPMAGVIVQLGAAADIATPAIAATAGHAAIAMPSTVDIATWQARVDGALPWIVALWAAGACVLSLRMAMGLAWIQRLRATPQGAAHATWQARLDVLAGRFGLKRDVALRLVDALDTPASAGWWRPVVLLPTALITRMPPDLIEALLAHELAHIRRHDYLVNLLQGVVEALLFYHPVTWWLSRRIRIEREHIADQLAAGVTGAPRRLALALSELADLNRPCCAPPHLAQAAHGGHLMSRIEHLLRPARHAVGGKIAFPLLGLAAACIAFYAHAQVSQPEATSPAAVAVPATVAQVTRLHTAGTRDAYALIRKGKDGFAMSGSSDDIPAIKTARSGLDSDFIWFRRADKAYVIVDPATVARAQEAWRDSDKLGNQMEALGEQMEVHGAKMEALGEQMEQLAPPREESPAMKAAAQRMEELGKQQGALGAQQAQLAAAMARGDEAQRGQLDRQMEALSNQQEALSRQMEQQSAVLEDASERLEAQQAPMEALGRQMEAAGKPMEALGKQMEALGEQQEKLVAQAERELQQLIDEAVAKGLATPAPRTTTQ
jgi:beta-lactamase regulating signal transducer with metallopeptidase domain